MTKLWKFLKIQKLDVKSETKFREGEGERERERERDYKGLKRGNFEGREKDKLKSILYRPSYQTMPNMVAIDRLF